MPFFSTAFLVVFLTFGFDWERGGLRRGRGHSLHNTQHRTTRNNATQRAARAQAGPESERGHGQNKPDGRWTPAPRAPVAALDCTFCISTTRCPYFFFVKKADDVSKCKCKWPLSPFFVFWRVFLTPLLTKRPKNRSKQIKEKNKKENKNANN
jgi:hypothetical protein